MPLTSEERKAVVARMREYPKGVHPQAWGYGPMAVIGQDAIPPGDHSREVQGKYG